MAVRDIGFKFAMFGALGKLLGKDEPACSRCGKINAIGTFGQFCLLPMDRPVDRLGGVLYQNVLTHRLSSSFLSHAKSLV